MHLVVYFNKERNGHSININERKINTLARDIIKFIKLIKTAYDVPVLNTFGIKLPRELSLKKYQHEIHKKVDI